MKKIVFAEKMTKDGPGAKKESEFRLASAVGADCQNVLPLCAISFAICLKSTAERPVKPDEMQNAHQILQPRRSGTKSDKQASRAS